MCGKSFCAKKRTNSAIRHHINTNIYCVIVSNVYFCELQKMNAYDFFKFIAFTNGIKAYKLNL